MQSIKNIYEKIYDFENLHKAWEEARKGKRYRDDVLIFNRNYEEQLINIQNHLIYETYEVGKYHTFYVYEPKKRLIMSLPFKDRIVQWAIYRQLFPLYEKTFIFDSYACRKGKGTHKAADRLQYWLRQTERKPERYYYLKMDISKYFYRVDHDILLKILARRIKDQRLLNLLEKIINCESMNFGLPPGKEPDEVAVSDRLSNKGMPIGNLTSQMFANIYLNEVDQYAKHELGLHYYIRYMDDIIILHHDKKYLAEVKDKIIKWFQAQEKQTTDIEDLKKQEKEDIKAMEDELCLLTYAVLACLKGLKEQGCNGPVTEAIGKIEKHINQKAHGQET